MKQCKKCPARMKSMKAKGRDVCSVADMYCIDLGVCDIKRFTRKIDMLQHWYAVAEKELTTCLAAFDYCRKEKEKNEEV